MSKRTFRQLTDRTHLKQLEYEILMLSFELDEEYGCDNMPMVYALVGAAYEFADRGRSSFSMRESFNYYIIERCAQALGRIRMTYS